MRLRRHRPPVVPTSLVQQIDEALALVDAADEGLSCVIAEGGALVDRRAAYTGLGRAFDAADALLRQATAIAKQHSYREWSAWRHRLSTLDTARQQHLFAGQDELCLLPLGCIRAIDTGMSGPAIGDLLHGETRAPGTAPEYGLDLEALLTAPTPPWSPPTAEPSPDAAVAVDLKTRSVPPAEAA